MSAERGTGPSDKKASGIATGNVTFTGTWGAEIYVDGQFVGNIPSTISLPAGRYKILVMDGKSADWMKILQVLAGSNVTLRAQLPTAQ
jgi:hypothetical protein